MKVSKYATWIFLAIGHASKTEPASLADIIAAADALNHSIPNRREIVKSVNNLRPAGLVSISNNLFSLTDQGRGIFLKACEHASNLFEQWSVVESLLQKHDLEVSSVEPWDTTEESVQAAFKKHEKQFSDTLKGL